MATVNYASKYSQKVDERFTLGSLTGALVNQEYDFIGVETVKVYSIPTVGMNDYKTSGSNRYGDPDELGNNEQEMTLSQDRSFTFTIDRKSYDDTQMTMEAGKALARQIDEVVIPEVDIYRIHKIAASAKKILSSAQLPRPMHMKVSCLCRRSWMMQRCLPQVVSAFAGPLTTSASSWMMHLPRRVIWQPRLLFVVL